MKKTRRKIKIMYVVLVLVIIWIALCVISALQTGTTEYWFYSASGVVTLFLVLINIRIQLDMEEIDKKREQLRRRR